MTHEVKLLTNFFDSVASGFKNFEIRLNDRNYRSGDLIIMKEWDREKMVFTGRVVSAEIGFVFRGGNYGIPEGYCVFSLLKLQRHQNENLVRPASP